MNELSWRDRAKKCGLNFRKIAALTGASEFTVSRHMSNEDPARVPRYIETIVIAWETMTGQQHGIVMDAVEALPAPRKIKRANNLPNRPLAVAKKPRGKPAAK